MSEEIRSDSAEPKDQKLDDSFASPSKYPWHVVITDGFAHTLWFETESGAGVAYRQVAQIINTIADYKNDIPRSLTIRDAVGERTFSTVGFRSVSIIHAEPLADEHYAKLAASVAKAGFIAQRAINALGAVRSEATITDGDAVPGAQATEGMKQ